MTLRKAGLVQRSVLPLSLQSTDISQQCLGFLLVQAANIHEAQAVALSLRIIPSFLLNQ